MPERLPDPREIGRYFALAQVGLEMVVPIVIGAWLDSEFHWDPWGVVGGVILGFVGGLAHLVHLSNKFEKDQSPQPPRDAT